MLPYQRKCEKFFCAQKIGKNILEKICIHGGLTAYQNLNTFENRSNDTDR